MNWNWNKREDSHSPETASCNEKKTWPTKQEDSGQRWTKTLKLGQKVPIETNSSIPTLLFCYCYWTLFYLCSKAFKLITATIGNLVFVRFRCISFFFHFHSPTLLFLSSTKTMAFWFTRTAEAQGFCFSRRMANQIFIYLLSFPSLYLAQKAIRIRFVSGLLPIF
jgi:hypothetical protein